MKTVHEWLEEYGESHQNRTNKALHWVCIPLIVFSLLGLLWMVPLPGVPWSNLVNFGVVFVGLAFIYYLCLSPSLAVGMGVVTTLMVSGLVLLERSVPVALCQLSLFVIAWAGQFVGHKIEGKKPSFFKDLQFLLIGPLWLLGDVYRKLGVRY